ncbi:MAG: nitrilase-related carbon-nitrogen hydrolase [Candidatus Bipolaricaulia bacterium]
MKVAVAQLAPGPNRAQNVAETINAIREAAERGAQLIVLPELCTSSYQLGNEPLERWAEEIPAGESVQRWLREAEALDLYMVAGLLERAGDHCYNTALVLGPQGVLARYRKPHLFGWEGRRLTAGNGRFHSIDVEGARLGVLICYDLRFVEAVRLLALDQVQLLCVPVTWTDTGKSQPWDQYGLCAAAHLALGHAYANRLFVLCANRVGTEKRVRYLGNSLIAGPTGQAVAGPAGPDERAVLVTEIDPRQADDKRVGPNDLFVDRRTDLYTIEMRSEKEVSHGLGFAREGGTGHRRQ